MICDEEPQRPSKAVSDSLPGNRTAEREKLDALEAGDLTESNGYAPVSADPGSQFQNPKALRGDLDAIVLMALRKEPGRRYPSIKQFVEDIDLYLEGRPVVARKDNLSYRAGKFVDRNVMRHWHPVLVSLVLFLALTGLVLGFSTYWRGPSGESVGPTKSVSPAAQEAYEKGRYLWNKRTNEDHQKAIEYFNQAIAIEPDYAEAYAGLADAYALLAQPQPLDIRREMIEKGRANAWQAIKLDPALAEPHAALGFMAYDFDWNWDAAEKEYKTAIQLNPNYATAHQWYAYLLQNIGRTDEAIAEIKRARELAPLSSAINRDVAEILSLSRHYDEAIEELRKRLEVEPRDWKTRQALADALWLKGMGVESIAEALKAAELAERNPDLLSQLAGKYHLVGRKAEAQKILL